MTENGIVQPTSRLCNNSYSKTCGSLLYEPMSFVDQNMCGNKPGRRIDSSWVIVSGYRVCSARVSLYRWRKAFTQAGKWKSYTRYNDQTNSLANTLDRFLYEPVGFSQPEYALHSWGIREECSSVIMSGNLICSTPENGIASRPN